MNILVTGGAGYIGSHTVVELLQSGHGVVVADDLSNASESVLDRLEKITGRRPVFCRGDVKDKAFLEALFRENQIDAAIHFAGYKAVGESVKKPLLYYRNNLDTMLTLLEVMAAHDCWKLVFSSSATVYGPENPIPYTEEMKTSATNPYGWTKVMIEQILKDTAAAEPRWRISCLRYFNPIGAHESGLIGEDPKGIPNNLMPYIAKVAAGELPELHVFGDDYPTPDGTGVRDYIHVVDLAKGHLRALEYLADHGGWQAVNLGTGRGTSVLELVDCYSRVNKIPVPYVVDGRRAGDLAAYYANADKAREELGWQAEKTVEQMCADTWNWIQTGYAGK